MEPRSIVVVGNGMVSVRFVERLRAEALGAAARVVVFGEEPRPAYDRVKLTTWFETRDPGALCLAGADWYREREVILRTGARVVAVDRAARVVTTAAGEAVRYDELVLATGSAPLVPPIPGTDRPGVFVYRTIEDLEAITAWAGRARRCAVLGGGLLGLEAARAAHDLGLETHVVELADRLMPRQLDADGSRLLEAAIRALGVQVHLGRATAAIDDEGLRFADGTRLAVDMIIISAGIRPRDELARAAGIAVGARGGVVVDDGLATSDPNVHAIGEVALHRGQIYGLVAPGYAMADVLARRLAGDAAARFEGADLSAKLKLMGVEVASFGDPFAAGDDVRAVVLHDLAAGVYKKLVLADGGRRLVGGMLVGDARDWARLAGLARGGEPLPGPAAELVAPPASGAAAPAALPDAAQVCACHGVSAACIRGEIRARALATVDQVKEHTKAGSGCGGCVPLVGDLLGAELAARGTSTRRVLCEHFDLTRQEMYDIVAVTGVRDFETLLARHGKGHGCEICKPTAASIFASVHNEMILDRHATLQDTNDRFLANLQRRGLYSVVPRIPGGEITPHKLVRLGQIAEKYGLYTKITGGQRIDLFGARVDQLPDIWEELVAAGFESGHAYGKAMRTVKSCVGSTWCRYGVQDSVGLAIRLEHRYKGVRAPHKLKAAVSGCIRECAEAQSKDFGVIATERGYSLYVGGNGGAKPRHADLLAADLDEPTLIKLIDRFVMFYIRTADRLTRTSVWLEKMEGGLAHLRAVIVDDALGLCAGLEADMQRLVDGYQCEWAAVVRDPAKRARFRAAAGAGPGASDADDGIEWVRERGQERPADWPRAVSEPPAPRRRLPVVATRWVRVARVDDIPAGGGVAVRMGRAQLAIFRWGPEGTLYATQNMCPHKQDLVLARGLLGDAAGEPKVACPQHKKTFSLATGACLSGGVPGIRTFPVRAQDGDVYVEVPAAAQELEAELCPGTASCASHAAVGS
jgi:nitrite reductase (NADH) large subunit